MTNGLNASNMFIFGGSASIGVERAGYSLERILELTDDMHELNAYHWAQNRPDVPIVPPSVWENDGDYLGHLRAGKADGVDYSFANCPCSGLSRINRNAGADQPQNVHFYRLFDSYKRMLPKAFTIENAPTLTTYGVSILKDMTTKLADKYNFTVISDQGMRHSVPMRRDRTMIFGWRRDYFDDGIPLVNPKKTGEAFVRDAIGDLSPNHLGSNVPNHSQLLEVSMYGVIDGLIPRMRRERVSQLIATARMWNEDKDGVNALFVQRLGVNEKQLTSIQRELQRVIDGECKWDKSAHVLEWDKTAPSMTSMARWVHPDENRPLTVREMSRFMGYPDDFMFHDGGKTHVVQCMAQGVPAQFSEWASRQAADAILKKSEVIATRPRDQTVLVYQDNKSGVAARLTADRVQELEVMRIGAVGQTFKIGSSNLENL